MPANAYPPAVHGPYRSPPSDWLAGCVLGVFLLLLLASCLPPETPNAVAAGTGNLVVMTVTAQARGGGEKCKTEVVAVPLPIPLVIAPLHAEVQ